LTYAIDILLGDEIDSKTVTSLLLRDRS